MYMKYNGASMPVHRARRELADVINRVAYARERILLDRRGKNVAAIVPIEDFELLEKLEDRIDLESARAALAGARGKKRVSWKQIMARYGL